MKDIVGMEKRKGRSMERCRGRKSSKFMRLEGSCVKRRMEIS
jgi:hypothetical protein